MKNTFEEQLRVLIKEYKNILDESAHPATGHDVLSRVRASELQTRCITAIERASGVNSTYSREVRMISKETGRRYILYANLAKAIGVARALFADIQNDYLKGLEEIIHGDVFSDFLEMSSYLVEQGYKDPAAVMAGSTLEVHLRKLCDKNGIDTLKRDGKPKKADSLNAELAGADVYTKLDQKNVTAWLGLRNYAAHGDYNKYDEGQVRLLIDGVRGFITRHPA